MARVVYRTVPKDTTVMEGPVFLALFLVPAAMW